MGDVISSSSPCCVHPSWRRQTADSALLCLPEKYNIMQAGCSSIRCSLTMSPYNMLLAGLIILSLVSYICTIIFNVFSAIAQDGLFQTTASNISNKYSLDVTPAGWTFSIWSVIYIWNGLWIVYSFSTIFRRNNEKFGYIKPRIYPPEFFALWILNNITNIGWLFMWDTEYMIYSNVFLVFIPITCFMMLQISYSRSYKYRDLLSENRVDLWCTRILVHNGLAMYATWTSIATVINFGIVLKYHFKVPDPDASNMVLCLVFFALVFWILLETFIFEKYVRYTVTIYPVAIFASVGVYFGNDPNSSMTVNDIVNVVTISVGCVACFLKFILLFTCGKLKTLLAAADRDIEKKKEDMKISDVQSLQTNGHTNPIPLEIIES